jgi:hypothetical protein
MTVTAEHVRAAAAACHDVLSPAVDLDWTVRPPDLEWTVFETGVHIADDQVFYAAQLIAQPDETTKFTPFQVTMWTEDKRNHNEGLVRTIDVCAEILARVVETSPRETHGYHNYGTSDPEGFAAMGAIETLVHTYDMAAGLGLDWRPPADLSADIVDRLFPDPPSGDPVDVLLWCSGRIPLGDLERRTDWRWDGRPHAER